MKNSIKLIPRVLKKTEKDSNTVIIPTYSINSNITATDYRSREAMDELREGFDKECIEFLKKAEKVDADNGAYMDQRVDSVAINTINNLKKEHAEHKRLILLPLDQMHEGDKIFSEENLLGCEKELERLIHKRDKYKRILHKGTAFEEAQGGEEHER